MAVTQIFDELGRAFPIRAAQRSALRGGLFCAILVAGGMSLAACSHHHHHDNDTQEVVVIRDEHGWDHRGYYDSEHHWHGGYYDDHHVYHDDAADWHH